jgi:hypothetical protein
MRNSIPCATLQEIGNKVGVSRERVRQILSRDSLSTKHYSMTYHCNMCGEQIRKDNKSGYCKVCKVKAHLVPLICDQCGTLFYRPQSDVITAAKRTNGKDSLTFCTKSCQGIYTANHYGFVAHPENSGYRKWDWDMIWVKHLETGYGSPKLSRLLNIPESTIDVILRHKRGGVKGNNRLPIKQIQVRWLQHLNFTDKEIMDYLKCSESTIWRTSHLLKVIVKEKKNANTTEL